MELTDAINVRLAIPQKDKLDRIRAETGQSLPELIRRAVDLYLERRTTAAAPTSAPEGPRPPTAAQLAPEHPEDLHEVPAFLAKPAPSRFARGVKIKRR
jgi:hypothetical protein